MCLLDLAGALFQLFIAHCSMPVFIFLLVYFTGLRDFSRIFDARMSRIGCISLPTNTRLPTIELSTIEGNKK